MASASAPTSELAVQLPAPASGLAVPPSPASTADAVDLSAGAAILEDPGPAAAVAAVASTRAGFLPDSRCLLIVIYRWLYSVNSSTYIRGCIALGVFFLLVFVTCINSSFSHLCLKVFCP